MLLASERIELALRHVFAIGPGNAVLIKYGERYQMPLEITQIAMGVTFLAIWAFAGDILVGRRK